MSLSLISQVYDIEDDSDQDHETEEEIEVNVNGNVQKSVENNLSQNIAIPKLSSLCANQEEINNSDNLNAAHKPNKNGTEEGETEPPLIDMGFTEGLMKTNNFTPSSGVDVETAEEVLLINNHSDTSSKSANREKDGYWATQMKSAKIPRARYWKWSWDQEKVKDTSPNLKENEINLGRDNDPSSDDNMEEMEGPPKLEPHFILKTEPTTENSEEMEMEEPPMLEPHFILKTEPTTEPVKEEHAFKCPFCFGVFLEGSEFISHLSIHTTRKVKVNGSIQDAIKTETEIVELSDEKIIRPNMGNGAVKCHYCNVTMSSPGKLESHLLIHEERDRPFKCDEPKCISFFLTLSSLRNHEHQVHNKMYCKFCGEVFLGKGKLTQHIRIHKGERPFKCPTCKMAFGRKDNFKRHMRRTHGVESSSFAIDLKPTAQLSFQHQVQDHPHKNVIVQDQPYTEIPIRKGMSYSCNSCKKVCKDRWTLTEHLRIHSGEKPFKCPICKTRFRRKDHVKGHMKKVHGKKPSSSLPIDLKPTLELSVSLPGHHITHQNEVIQNQAQSQSRIPAATGISCSFCGKLYYERSKLIEHIRIHTGEKPFKCSICKRRFRRKDHVKGHLRIVHRVEPSKFSADLNPTKELSPKPSVCPAHNSIVPQVKTEAQIHPCQVTVTRCDPLIPFFQNSKMDNTNSIRASGVKFTKTTASFRQPNIKIENGMDRQSLIRIKNTSGKKIFECKACGKLFQKSWKAIEHVVVHTLERPYECPECFKRFRWRNNLFVHRRIHSGQKPYKCKVCSKDFGNRANLIAHIRIHSGEKPHKCNICSKAFRNRANLTAHFRIHTGEKPHKCKICLKAFRNRANLTAHIRIHTGEKPHKCKICSKAFRNRANLTAHTRIHTGQKPYNCRICSKAFSNRTNLTAHSRIHSGAKPYKCRYCPQRFRFSSNLKVHVKGVHAH